MADDAGKRIDEAMKDIIESIPFRLDIDGFIRSAHNQLERAAGSDVPFQVIAPRLVEVLREIATRAVEEFTRRTGQPFLWQDEPEELPDQEPLMSFGIEVKDGKGNVTF